MSISKREILMGREIEYPLTEELEKNLLALYLSLNRLRELYGEPMFITSGYRPGRYNVAAGGATNSPHTTCEAADFRDGDNKIKRWINEEILIDCGLWLEDPSMTPTWAHFDIRQREKRIFIP